MYIYIGVCIGCHLWVGVACEDYGEYVQKVAKHRFAAAVARALKDVADKGHLVAEFENGPKLEVGRVVKVFVRAPLSKETNALSVVCERGCERTGLLVAVAVASFSLSVSTARLSFAVPSMGSNWSHTVL